MKSRSTTWFPIFLVMGLALLSFVLERTVRESSQVKEGLDGSEPDFVVEDFVTVTTDAKGRQSYELSAKRMTHYPEEDISELDSPRVSQLRPGTDGKAPLHASADAGTVRGRGDEVELSGNVVVRQQASGDRPELRLETTVLKYFPERNLATTTEPVTIIQGASRMTGVGMELFTEERRILLKSQVRGVYVRPGA